MTTSEAWQAICHPPVDEIWELFHQNSKIGRYYAGLPDEVVAAEMRRMWESYPYEAYPAVALPAERTPLSSPLGAAIESRTSTHSFVPHQITLADLASVLHAACGVNRPAGDTGYPRSLRVVPSSGGLYPLEVFVHSAQVEGTRAGLYHYNPVDHELRRLREGDLSREIGSAMVQDEIAYDATLVVFITAAFERVTFKYGARGYRFALLEAGHLAQNLNLAAGALGLGVLNIGGFFDREIDELLRLDGLAYSTVYMVAVGKSAEDGKKAPRGG